MLPHTVLSPISILDMRSYTALHGIIGRTARTFSKYGGGQSLTGLPSSVPIHNTNNYNRLFRHFISSMESMPARETEMRKRLYSIVSSYWYCNTIFTK